MGLTHNYMEYRRLTSEMQLTTSWYTTSSTLKDMDGNIRNFTYGASEAYLSPQYNFTKGEIALNVGTGTTPESPTDYALANDISGTGSVSSITFTGSSEDGAYRLRVSFKYTAPSNSDITITEVGLFKKLLFGTSSSNTAWFLMARHVLASSITVPANSSCILTFDILEE